MSPRISGLSAALALACGAAFAADPVYKSTMPDGRVVYGESPVQGARRIDKVAPPPENAGVVLATPADKSRAAAIVAPGAAVSVIPTPARPPVQGTQQGYSANPDQSLPSRRY